MPFQRSGADNTFDELYQKDIARFGSPYQELQEYFKKYEPKGTVLDIGAGQGRDALYLASLGYAVTAIDDSAVGIAQMAEGAKKQKLKINGIVADALAAKIDKKYDVILFDMLLHAFEEAQQKELLLKYAEHVDADGMICVVFPDDINTDHILPTLNIGQKQWKLVERIVIEDIPQVGDEETDYAFVMLCVKCT